MLPVDGTFRIELMEGEHTATVNNLRLGSVGRIETPDREFVA
jgi:hypothetical protein